MKKWIAIYIMLTFAACDKPGDCVKSSGALAVRDCDVPGFSKIMVRKGIAVVVSQGDAYKVEVHSGENLINDIQVNVVGDMLVLEDNTTCNWVREYGETTVYVTAPNLTDIYSKTELNIISNGILTYPNLRLVAMDSYDNFTGTGTGDFVMQMNNQLLVIETNTVSRFFISGNTEDLNVSVYASGAIVHAETLLAQAVHVFHRGSNDLFVHPLESISGDIYSVGNIISIVRPPVVNVTEHYRGRLIF